MGSTAPAVEPQVVEPNMSAQKELEIPLRQLHEIKRRANDLRRTSNYTVEDIEILADEAGPIFQMYWRGDYPEDFNMELLIEDVFALFFSLSFTLERVDPALQPLYARLSNAYNGLQHLWQQHRSSFNTEEVRAFQEELAAVEAHKKNNVFVAPDGTIPRGQAMISTTLEKAYRTARLLLIEKEAFEGVSPALQNLYFRLQGIHSALVDFSTGKTTPTLENVQQQQDELGKIAELEKDGVFKTRTGDIPAGQAIIKKLMDKNYSLVHHLLVGLERKGRA